MLYGSPTGQWALAVLESEGLDTSPENMRFVIDKMDEINLQNDRVARRDALQKEYDKAISTAKKLEENASKKDYATKETDKTCAAQLRKIADTYDKQIKALESEMSDADPLKAIR